MEVLADIQIFEKFGLDFALRWAHVLVGIAWIGLLYYFNFVQVPAFAEFEPVPATRPIDKLASRALWWFRWAAAATFLFGLHHSSCTRRVRRRDPHCSTPTTSRPRRA